MGQVRASAFPGVLIATCALLFPSACSPSAAPAASSVPRTAPSPVPSPKELLTDLARWDAAVTELRRAAAEDVARRLPDFELLRLETFSCGGQTHEVAVYLHAKTRLEFVLVPAGTFEMGSPLGEADREPGERHHLVTLTRPFLVCRTECTQAAYSSVIVDEPRPSRFPGAQRPRESVSWSEAMDFCRCSGLSLPTEAEWEWACRGGTTTAFSFGSTAAAATDYVWCGEALYGLSAESASHPVAQKRPNSMGLFDLLGNVAEWCSDWYDEYPAGHAIDPVGPTSGRSRVVRGE